MLADAIVVLGCRVGASGRLSRAAAARTSAAARAFHDGVAPLVVASGGRRWGGQAEARSMADDLRARGVPDDAVVEELCSLSTFENAVFSASILGRRGAQRVAVVTSAWHMARAAANFRALGVEVVSVPAEDDGAGTWVRATRAAQERARRWLDAARWERTGLIRESAARFVAGA